MAPGRAVPQSGLHSHQSDLSNYRDSPLLQWPGTAEQWIKEGKYALNRTRLSCHKFVANQVRLGLFVMAYNLGNFLRRLAVPEEMKHWVAD